VAVALFGISGGVWHGAGDGGQGRANVAAELAPLTPDEDETIPREAGFSAVQMFYMGFAFRRGL